MKQLPLNYLTVAVSLWVVGSLGAYAQDIPKEFTKSTSIYSLNGSIFSPPRSNQVSSSHSKSINLAPSASINSSNAEVLSKQSKYGPRSWELLDQSPLPPGPPLPSTIQDSQ